MAPTVSDQSLNSSFSRPAGKGWAGWAMALTATLGYSFAPPAAKVAILAGVPPSALMALRMTLTMALMGGFMLLFKPGLLKIDRRGLAITMGTGVINGFGFLAFFLALTRLEAAVASMIFSLNPLVVILMLALRGEPVTRRYGLRLLLGIGGVYLLIGPAGTVDPTGALLVLITVFVFATQMVSIQWFLQAYHAWTITFYMVLGMSAVGLLWWLSQGWAWSDPGNIGWAAIITLALGSTFLARLAMFGGIKILGGSQVAMTVPLETFLSVMWAVLFLQERLSLVQWLGGLLISASMILAIHRLRLSRRSWSRL